MSASDGCSVPGPLKRLIPELARFAEACDQVACRIHDDAYARGGTSADRIVEDYKLFLAARAVIADEWAARVFDAVRTYGASSWGVGPWHGGSARWPEATEAP